MSNKTYGQYCGIAVALDRVGDRWTLLILRELWLGDRRFMDLRRALPGIAPNLLSDRLRGLEEVGLIEQKELPPPAARTVYALTSEGLQVGPILRELARFGLNFLGAPIEGGVRPLMAVQGTLGALFDPLASSGRDLLMRFDLDGEVLWLEVRDGELVAADPGRSPDLTFVGSAAGLVELCRAGATIDSVAPRLRVEGSRTAKRAFVQMFPDCN